MKRPLAVRNTVTARSQSPRLAPRQAGSSRLSAGFTLIEVLVAMAVTLMLMAIVVTIFGAIGENVSKNNSSMEMNDQLRSVKQRLQLDLSGVTAQMLPPRRDENGEGYFEIIEGPVGRLPPNTARVQSETLPSTPNGTPGPMGPDTTVGDNDDMLMFTTRSKGEMFLGRGVAWSSSASQYVPTALQSQVAEVAWFIRGTTLYRRQLLVRPDLPTTTTINGQYVVPQPNNTSVPYFQPPQFAFPTNFYALTDLSARAAGGVYDLSPSPPSFYVVANSLEDLTKRENRFAHRPMVAGAAYAPHYGWPHDVRGWGLFYSATPYGDSTIGGQIPTTGRLGLPTLQECSSLYWPLPGTTDISSYHQILLGDQGANGMSINTSLPEQFDAWARPFPAWYTKDALTGTMSTAASAPLTTTMDPLTGSLTTIFPPSLSPAPFGSRYGEDIIMTHVLSFDVRVWDPDAALISYTDSNNVTSLYAPGDPAYLQTVMNWVNALQSNSVTPYAIASRGAYVDLNYAAPLAVYLLNPPFVLTPASTQLLQTLTGYQMLSNGRRIWNTFAGPGDVGSGLAPYQFTTRITGSTLSTDGTGNFIPEPYGTAVYDTGSWHYENDGINQGPMSNNVDAGADEGTNGLDDNGDGVVDDANELESPPPYFDPIRGGYPLRGIQIKIRCFDADSQEIREVTVVQEFVPE